MTQKIIQLDENKRTILFSTLFFLKKNNIAFKIDNEELVAFMVSVDKENTTVDQIASWLKDHADSV